MKGYREKDIVRSASNAGAKHIECEGKRRSLVVSELCSETKGLRSESS